MSCMGFATSSSSGCPRGCDPPDVASQQRSAQRMVTKRTDRVVLVLDNVRDRKAELAAMQCADYLGVLRVWRVEEPEDRRRRRSPSPLRDGGAPVSPTSSVGPSFSPGDQGVPEQLHIQTFSSADHLVQQLRRAGIPLWVMTSSTAPTLPLETPDRSPRSSNGHGQYNSPVGPATVYPPIPLDSPHLPPPSVPRVALVLGDHSADHLPSLKLCRGADLRVCLPKSHGGAEGLPLPGAVALALQAVLQHFPKEDDEALFYDANGNMSNLRANSKGLCHPNNNCCFLPNESYSSPYGYKSGSANGR